jgi:hypothetical protein
LFDVHAWYKPKSGVKKMEYVCEEQTTTRTASGRSCKGNNQNVGDLTLANIVFDSTLWQNLNATQTATKESTLAWIQSFGVLNCKPGGSRANHLDCQSECYNSAHTSQSNAVCAPRETMTLMMKLLSTVDSIEWSAKYNRGYLNLASADCGPRGTQNNTDYDYVTSVTADFGPIKAKHNIQTVSHTCQPLNNFTAANGSLVNDKPIADHFTKASEYCVTNTDQAECVLWTSKKDSVPTGAVLIIATFEKVQDFLDAAVPKSGKSRDLWGAVRLGATTDLWFFIGYSDFDHASCSTKPGLAKNSQVAADQVHVV